MFDLRTRPVHRSHSVPSRLPSYGHRADPEIAGEQELEFKRDLSSPDGVLRSIVAFANSAGGVLVVGSRTRQGELWARRPRLPMRRNLPV